MRRDAKRDANEREIIDALEAAGCLVTQLSGKGLPDLLVYRHATGRLHLIEAKNDEWRGRLTPEQIAFIARGYPVSVVVDKYEALHAVGLRKG